MSPNAKTAPVPPSDLDSEESVLGAILLGGGRVVDAVSEIVEPGDFYRESHAKIYRAALALHAAGEPVDVILVTAELERRGELAEIGGRERVHELGALVPATGNAAHYAARVHETATYRGLTTVGERISRLGWDRPEPGPELVDQAAALVFDLARNRNRGEFAAVGDSLPDALTRLQELHERGDKIVGVPSGFGVLDALTAGFQSGNLVVVAGRPSMGKSGFAVCVAAHVALRVHRPVAIFTLEMSTPEIQNRFLAAEGTVDLLKFRNGRLDAGEWKRTIDAAGVLQGAPIFVDDSVAISLAELRSRARWLKNRHPSLSLVVVDYLQLMGDAETDQAENRVQAIGRISRGLKVLARDLEVPVLALSQLSRGVESRHDKRPMLADLRESGAIEQDADVVIFIYRDDYYNPEDAAVEGTEGVTELIVAKHRNGPVGMVKIFFAKKFAAFTELDRHHE